MSAHLHGDFLTRFAPRKPRRTWLRTVIDILVLLALSALAGWLLHCVRHAALPDALRLPGAVVAPVSPGMVTVLMIVLSALIIALVARKMARNDAEARLRWSAAAYEEDPLAARWAGLDAAEARRILGAAIAELCSVRDLMRGGGHDSNPLAGHRLHGVVLCLGNLSDLMPVTDVMPALGMAPLTEEESRRREALFGRITKVLRGIDWTRHYPAPAASHKPSHGGYAA